jgi:hypothetical protein
MPEAMHKLVQDRSSGQLKYRCACDTGHAVTPITLTGSWPGHGVWHRATCSCGWKFEHTVADATNRVLADHIAASHQAAGAANNKGEAR